MSLQTVFQRQNYLYFQNLPSSDRKPFKTDKDVPSNSILCCGITSLRARCLSFSRH